MLSARAYSFHQKSKLAISLSWIGGYTNVIAMLTCGWVVSHMTGPTTWFGRAIVEGHAPVGDVQRTAFFLGFVIAAFFGGCMLSALLMELAERGGRPSKYVVPMAVEAILLAVFATCLNLTPPAAIQHTRAVYLMTGVAALAMGLQNATVTRISGAVVRTTHVTGVVTDLGLETVQYLFWFFDQARGRSWLRGGRLLKVSQRHPTAQRLALLLSIFGSFLFGAIAGTFAFNHVPTLAMLLPIGFLCFIILMDWMRPIGDVREIDLLGDPELKLHGILHSLLPPELGIYRLAAHQHRNGARAPNFQVWAEHLPQRWRVVILGLSPVIRLTENALLDLEQAMIRCRNDHRHLILCGMSTAQYKVLDHGGLIEKLGPENVCVDLEFAIARGLDLARGAGAAAT